MLDLAIKHEQALQEAYIKIIDNPLYKHFNSNGYNDFKLTLVEDNWTRLQYVSIKNRPTELVNGVVCTYNEPKILGFFEITRDNVVNSGVLSVIHFGFENASPDENITFASDLRKFFKKMFDEKKLSKMEIACRGSNPALKKYNGIIRKLGGRYVGHYSRDRKDSDGELVDSFLFEISRFDFNNSRNRIRNKNYESKYPINVETPVGIKPRWLFLEERITEIKQAIQRYSEVGLSPPDEWYTELIQISHEYNFLKD